MDLRVSRESAGFDPGRFHFTNYFFAAFIAGFFASFFGFFTSFFFALFPFAMTDPP